MVTTRSGRRVNTAKNERNAAETYSNESETDGTSSDIEILDAPVICRMSSTDTEVADATFDQQIDISDTENENGLDAHKMTANDAEVDHALVNGLATNEAEDDDDSPVEISSKHLPSNDLPPKEKAHSCFEEIQQCLIEKEKMKQQKSKRLKRKKMPNGTLNVKLKGSEFNVIPLDGKYKSPIEPAYNFRADLLLSRTEHLRFRNGAKQFCHRSKWDHAS